MVCAVLGLLVFWSVHAGRQSEQRLGRAAHRCSGSLARPCLPLPPLVRMMSLWCPQLCAALPCRVMRMSLCCSPVACCLLFVLLCACVVPKPINQPINQSGGNCGAWRDSRCLGSRRLVLCVCVMSCGSVSTSCVACSSKSKPRAAVAVAQRPPHAGWALASDRGRVALRVCVCDRSSSILVLLLGCLARSPVKRKRHVMASTMAPGIEFRSAVALAGPRHDRDRGSS